MAVQQVSIGSTDSMAAVRAWQAQLRYLDSILLGYRFFDPSVSVDGDGAFDRPFKTFNAERLLHGHNNLVKYGSYIQAPAGTAYLLPAGATAKAPLVLGAYGDPALGRPIFDGRLSNKVFRVAKGATNIRMRDFDVIGPAVGDNRLGISVQVADADVDARTPFNLHFENVRVRDLVTDGKTDCNGIKLYGADNKLLDCEVADISNDCLWFHGDRLLIQGSTFARPATDGRGAGDCIQCGGRSDDVVVRGCVVDHSNVDGKQGYYASQDKSVSERHLIEDSAFIGFDSAANQTPLHAGAKHSTVRRNIVSGGVQGVLVGEDGVAHNNVIFATAGRGIELKARAQALHNTIVQTGGQASQELSVGIRATGEAAKALNNAILGFVYGIIAGADFAESNNAFAASIPYLKNGAKATATAALYGDFGLDDAFRPGASSALRSAAASVGTSEKKDRDQRAFTDRMPIGAYIGIE